MSVATVTEISATSKDGFEAAVNEAIARQQDAAQRGECGSHQNVLIEDGNITGYQVNLEVTFVLDD
jgi:flavin-binding protein dodecin